MVVGALYVATGPDVVVVLDGSVALPLAGGGGGGGSLWVSPPQATVSVTDNAIAVVAAAHPTVDTTSISPPTSVFTMVANWGRLCASTRLLDSPTSQPAAGHTTRSSAAGRNGAAKCRDLRPIPYKLTTRRGRLDWQHDRPHATSLKGVNALTRTLFDSRPPLEFVARPAIPIYRSPRNLPPPALDEWSWQLRGLCRDHPAEVFFPEEVRGRPLRRREDAAKAICLACPVLERCRTHALSAPEPYGIWGAMTARERAIKMEAEG